MIRKLPWNVRYSILSYLKSALWLVPLIAIAIYQVLKYLLDLLGEWLQFSGFIDENTALLGLSVAGAQSMLNVLINATMSFLVFTFGSLLVAIQVAGGQYTPRIIATLLLRDNAIRGTVALFVFTFLYAIRVLNHMGGVVDQFNLFLAGMLGLASVLAFLYLIDHAARLLRPVSLVDRVARQGMAVIDAVYPQLTGGKLQLPRGAGSRVWDILPWSSRGRLTVAGTVSQRAAPDRVIYQRGGSGTVLAVNLEILVDEAQRADGVVEFASQVGNFVAMDEPLFYLYGNAGAFDDATLRSAVAFGSERTMEQDPMFSLRILVDIALKALSPAINDPTTAVIAIDQLHRVLRLVGKRSLGAEEIADATGTVRLVFRTPNWEDFVHLTFREIRQCGANNLQIPRRLRAMIANLLETLPEHRHAALREELDLLDRAVVREQPFPEDLALARVPDPQGLGGSSGMRPRA